MLLGQDGLGYLELALALLSNSHAFFSSEFLITGTCLDDGGDLSVSPQSVSGFESIELGDPSGECSESSNSVMSLTTEY